MDQHFGQLIDYLRGELIGSDAAAVRARLEDDAEYFDQFQRLKRTFAVLRSLPSVQPGATQWHPQHDAADFAATLRREFEARDWLSLLPWIDGREEFLRALRTEFTVRALAGTIPLLKPQVSFIAALRREFSARALSLPMLEPSPEFVAALREQLNPRAMAASIPLLEPTERFKRRLQIALHEAAPAPAVALPEVPASDPFRRRLFKRLLLGSRRSVREEPRRADPREYQWGRELRGGLRRSRRSMAFTMAVHVLAIAATLFIFARPSRTIDEPRIMRGEAVRTATPLLPGARDESGLNLTDPFPRPHPIEEDWRPGGIDPGIDSEIDRPSGSAEQGDKPIPEPEQRESALDDPMRDQMRDGVPGFFRLRAASRAQKIEYLGREDLHDALDAALSYLEDVQHPNGSWRMIGVRRIPDSQGLRDLVRVELTGIALLAFLGDGHSSARSPVGYDSVVREAVAWLVSQQNEDGLIGPPLLGNVQAHAIATLALAEEFGMTRDWRLREPLRKACRWLCAVKAADSDGFPYKIDPDTGPGPASLTTSVWAYMALATARTVRVPPIDLPQQRLDGFIRWYSKATGIEQREPLTDQPELLASTDLLPSAAAGALSLFAIETDFEQRHATFLARISRDLPDLQAGTGDDRADMRYLFFGSLAKALHTQRGGTSAGQWQRAFAETLLYNQQHDGSFDLGSNYARLYGRVFTTALAALSIENAYRVNLLTD